MLRTSEPDEPHLGRLLMWALRAVQTESVTRLAERGHTGVRVGHLPVFSHVDDGGTRISDLATRAGMSRQMMGRLVRELEAAGYVSTRADPTDQRAVVVALTDRGRSFCADAAAVTAEQDRRYAALLGSEELVRLRAALRLLAGQGGAGNDR